MRLTHAKLWYKRTYTVWFYLHTKIKSSCLGMHAFTRCKNIKKQGEQQSINCPQQKERACCFWGRAPLWGINHLPDFHLRAGNRGVLRTFLYVCQNSRCKIFCYFNSNMDDFTAYINLQPYFHENCFFVMCWVTELCLTLCDPVDYSPPSSSVQGIFLTQGSNLGLLHCRWILYHLSHQGNLFLCYMLGIT